MIKKNIKKHAMKENLNVAMVIVWTLNFDVTEFTNAMIYQMKKIV